jgi:N-acetylglucosaminyl-diphospho-decaprenol L-rhamnosyltransferase
MRSDVVFVSYHSEQALAVSVPVLTRFAGDDARFFLVDNAPDGGLETLVARLGERATLIRNTANRGFSAAVNQAISAGSGELILLANPDILSIRGTAKEIEKIFADNPRVAAVGGVLLARDGSRRDSCMAAPSPLDYVMETLPLAEWFPRWDRPKRMRMLDFDGRQERVVDAVCGACVYLRRDAVDDVGLFDERFFVYCEETDWMIRAKQRGWQTVFTPRLEAVHDAGTSSEGSTAAELSLLLLGSQHAYIRKHFGYAPDLLVRACLVLFDLLRWVKAFWRGPERHHRQQAALQRIRANVSGSVRS